MTEHNLPRVFDVKEVAAILNVHKETVLRQLRNGKLKGFKVGYDWRVNEDQLSEYMNNSKPAS
jgi:excisionase family DNA binding protein